MNHRLLTEHLVELEHRCDPAALRHHGLQVWPVARLAIWNCINGSAAQFLRLPEAALCSVRHVLTPHGAATLAAAAEQAQAGREVDMLLFSAAGYYTDQCEGLAYNRHVDPLLDLFGDRWRMVPLELVEGRQPPQSGQPPQQARKHPGLVLEYAVQRRPMPGAQAGKIAGFEALAPAVQALLGEAVDHARILQDITTLRAWRALYTQVLQALQPRCVGIVCYYHLQAMGLAWACRSLGIPCVELQHGKQGKYHGMYTHWTRMPADGYEVLPDHFWLWGEESRQNMVATLAPDRRAPVVFTAGSPWLTLWLDGPGCDPSPEMQQRLDARCAGRHPVLVSLQPLEEPVPPALFQAIRQSPPSWLWLLRLHPRNVAEAGSLAAWFAELGFRNVEVALANEAPLYSLLTRSRHHVTGFSSVAYEALQFGLSSTVFHPTTRDMYADYLASGHFRYADSTQAMLHSVAQGIAEPPRQEAQPYILHGQDRLRACLERLLARNEGQRLPEPAAA
ncbi:MAG: hypothetical protein LDL27_09795 [Desulfovibrio sp.]|nr:hypothetical protein [Desulfovibrio sp.]